ncbi:MAG: nucleotidyltransferase domain-containing protein [Gammaproteobacteria bacterium]|nr:nucleotidyltransferase domain-containing protein [Gammaproteobacteria bacterium]MXW46091.1 nucleotidyltransferase domain-containing protein [Gammaproteobacteria bacterium]MYD02755.1 nucleotidyltransferase domain-containing protein [Gammaproteobacteria bacterium]MYI25832.1 nucleotidyltransferase domain-containing protein [Gammaproteobacteria bacterium]
MTDSLHLPDRHRATIEALVREHLPDVEVWAYGSRANGRSHEGSDLDLILRGPGLRKIPLDCLAGFTDALRESTIPFLVEARDWARAPERFHQQIESEHIVLIAAGESSE